jgi:APA family basic amino acid/polyamine antiporter
MIVVANMIGTGVFTSLAYQAADIPSGFAIIILWVIGGIAALAGALSYAEIGALFPRSGGEYHYLSKIYHPSLGFMSGWISATVGFAAPVALAAIALGNYTGFVVLPLVPESWTASLVNVTKLEVTALNSYFPKFVAAGIIIVISFIHSISIKGGSRFQNIFTTIKLLMIVVIIAGGLIAGNSGDFNFQPTPEAWKAIASPGFAISFFFVSLAYSGWNASAYIASEIKNPKKNLPRSLFLGTAIVTILYVSINFIFMYVTPKAQMMTKDGPVNEIAGVAAQNIFGTAGGQVMSIIIAVLLISTVSSMVLAGPRVTHSMGEDYRILKLLSRKNKSGIPALAIWVQASVSILFIFTATFKQVITYVSFTLSVFTFLTVLGIFIMRFRDPKAERSFKVWGYPITPIIFLLISVWLLYFGFTTAPLESLAGLGTGVLGLVFYFIDKGLKKKSLPNNEIGLMNKPPL